MKRFLLIAGMDYEFKGINFRGLCENRIKKLIHDNKSREEMYFKTFDFRKGEIEDCYVNYNQGKKVIRKVKKTFKYTALTKKNYVVEKTPNGLHYTYKKGQDNPLSILDVYEMVRDIGSFFPGTLHEVSFFSHSWMGGPVLVNSYDNTPITINTTMRSSGDMDPRITKDFVAPTMTAEELKDFQSAFHKDGYIWSWGCTFPTIVDQIMIKILTHSSYKSSGLKGNTIFKITNFTDEQAIALEQTIINESGYTFTDKRNFEIEFKYLVSFFCHMTVSSYLHHLAVNSRIKVIGGVMGTYSIYDSYNKENQYPLMRVDKKFSKRLLFYENYLHFAFDTEKRGYGIYYPNFTCPVAIP